MLIKTLKNVIATVKYRQVLAIESKFLKECGI
jgi:hypothetical protein